MPKPTSYSILGIVFSLLLEVPAFAQLDDDNDQLSDIWEAAYPPEMQPQNDEDEDGFTNLEESRAGTDPRDSNDFPSGPKVMPMINEQIEHRFSSKKGVLYQTFASNDLNEWVPIGSPTIGTGEEIIQTFDLQTTFTSGGIIHKRWEDVIAWNLNDIRDLLAQNPNEANYDAPEFDGHLTSLQILQSDPDIDEQANYGSGWIIPPVSGDYIFWISSDDLSEFWLSTDSDPSNVQLVANVPGWCFSGEWDKYPEQRSVPITLQAGQSYYFEFLVFDGAGGDHLTIAWALPGNAPEDREIISGEALSSTGQSLSDRTNDSGQIFFRHEVSEVDSDTDGLTDYEESILGTSANNATTTPRVDDIQVAQEAVTSPSVVSIGVANARAYESDSTPAQLRIFRTGGIGPIDVPLNISGSASHEDYLLSTNSVHFPAGSREIILDVHPTLDTETESAETVDLQLKAGEGYLVGNPANAMISIDDARDIIYIASLRNGNTTIAGGVGYAIMQQTGNGLSSRLSLSFQGLTGNETGAEIYLSSDGRNGPSVFTFPSNQVQNEDWDLSGENGISRENILTAALNGELWVRVISDVFPEGELKGQLQANAAWQIMPPVPDAPPPVLTSTDEGELARFLIQTTFGPSPESLHNLSGNTFEEWIETQMALPPTFHTPLFEAWRTVHYDQNDNDGFQTPRRQAWWDIALTAPDQLRQRMAFALSQILVISQTGALDGAHEGVTNYYDLLVQNAFGNYRDLLQEITLSPMMGTYLSMLRNRKPDPLTGHEPDENYAREIMQLFSIGLMQTHLDGTIRLDSEGKPIPTYTQEDIVELAHIFTGWGPHYDNANPPTWPNGSTATPGGWFLYGRDDLNQMTLYPEYHDEQDRQFLNSPIIPGSLAGEQKLEVALDTIFNHPNLPPFVAKQLIQKFITSNPSPGYVYRVAQVFADNGTGIRGDLGATLKAVLLDYEARNPEVRESISYGKPLEPVIRMTRMMRALDLIPANAADPGFGFELRYNIPEQSPLDSPSVFNFFQPGYSAPGPIAEAGLHSPEFQIFAETTAISQANFHFQIMAWGLWTFRTETYVDPEDGETKERHLIATVDYTELLDFLRQPGKSIAEGEIDLVNFYDTYWLHGTMSDALRQEIHNALDSLPAWFDSNTDRLRDRVFLSSQIVLTSPEFFVQR